MTLNNGDYSFSLVERGLIKDFIEKHHYSQNMNGVKSSLCFGMFHQGKLIGAMVFGQLGMAGAWKKYAESEEDVLELRRLVLIDETPKNSESWFIGHAMRWIKKNTNVRMIVSYADPNWGHQGTIYKATNFELMGYSSPGKVIVWNGKKYHDKTIRTKYKGKLKPFAQRVKEALDSGEAFYETQKPKIIYLKKLR